MENSGRDENLCLVFIFHARNSNRFDFNFNRSNNFMKIHIFLVIKFAFRFHLQFLHRQQRFAEFDWKLIKIFHLTRIHIDFWFAFEPEHAKNLSHFNCSHEARMFARKCFCYQSSFVFYSRICCDRFHRFSSCLVVKLTFCVRLVFPIFKLRFYIDNVR